MRTRIASAVAAVMTFSSLVAAEDTLPLQAVNRAGAVIDAAVEAYGGSEQISSINSVIRVSEYKTWATNQSRKPGPPWDQSSQQNFAAIDFETKTFVGMQEGSQGGFNFKNTQVIEGDAGWTIDYRAGTVTQQASPDFNNSSGPLIRVTAPLLVKQLQERRHTSHWLGEVEFQGRPHDVITLVMEVGPALSLYFDQETHLLSRSERVLAPFGQVDYRFSDYRKIDGIPFAGSFQLYVNDEPNLDIRYSSTEVNKPIASYAELPQDLEPLEGVAQPTEVVLDEVADGVYLVGAGGTYALFVEMDDHIVGVGGTAGISERIKKLRETVKDKPITHAVLTHHHGDHLAGVRAWESEGAVVYTVRDNEQVVRNNADDGEALQLEFVQGKTVLDGGQRLELVNIGPTPHVENLLVAYLPQHGLLFEADHFPNPANGQVAPAQPVTVRLAEAIREQGLEVKHIVGAHSQRVASIKDLEKALALKPKVEVASAH